MTGKESWSAACPALIVATVWSGMHGFVLFEITEISKESAMPGGKTLLVEIHFDMYVEALLGGLMKPVGKHKAETKGKGYAGK